MDSQLVVKGFYVFEDVASRLIFGFIGFEMHALCLDRSHE